MHKKSNIIPLALALVLILVCVVWVVLNPQDSAAPGATTGTSDTQGAATTQPQPAGFDKTQFSLDDPASPWVVVNKQRPLPDNYAPVDLVTPAVPLRLASGSEEMLLRQEAARALETMFAAAADDGLTLKIASAYRSQSYQTGLYNSYVARDGQAAADRYSARPGHSEHQTGWGVDVEPASRECEVEECFGDLAEGQWVAAQAHNYGFVIRYGKGQEAITGYIYEPWHLRYVGQPLAQELYKSGQTLEEFFGLPAAPDYSE